MDVLEQLAIIGCGLMGGSFALAAKRAGLARRVVGFSPSRASGEQALRMGAIDAVVADAAEAVRESDLVIVSVPVSATEDVLRTIRPALREDALVMDVGSTKADVAAAAERALGDRLGAFVPAHPMAGKESAGVAHAEATLYDGRLVILTPLAQNTRAHVARATQAWSALGASVRTMAPAEHDAAIAAVSHLPHLIAFAYLEALVAAGNSADRLPLAGPGFRDFTRIAGGDATMWRDIFLSNRDELLQQSRAFRAALERLEGLIEAGDAGPIHDTIGRVSALRAQWHLGRRAP